MYSIKYKVKLYFSQWVTMFLSKASDFLNSLGLSKVLSMKLGLSVLCNIQEHILLPVPVSRNVLKSTAWHLRK